MNTIAEVWIELLPTDEGGRRDAIYSGYRPHLKVKGGDGTYLGVTFVGPDGPIEPGGKTFATVRFTYEPRVDYGALTVGAEFEIMEGGKVVGSGRVTGA